VSERYLREVLRLAARGRYRVSPNPMVGSVVVGADGRVVGRGYHHRVGGDHAEVEALNAAASSARGATLFVNLEPCSHHGRTPPCVDRIIESGVVRVVASHQDPNPEVSGRGFKSLREAGIDVEIGVLARRAVGLNLAFLVPHVLDRPQVTLKWAMSADGKIATAAGESQWISSPRGRRWALGLREEHDAILVGSGTVLADDPSLNRRLGKAAGPITRVILDRRLRCPPTAKLLSLEGPVLIYTEASPDARTDRLEGAGATVVYLPKADLASILGDLHARGVGSVLVEGGGEILGSFAVAGLFDSVQICCAPLLIGGGAAPGPLGGAGVASLSSARRLEELQVRHRGPDLLISGLRAGCFEEIERVVLPASQRCGR